MKKVYRRYIKRSEEEKKKLFGFNDWDLMQEGTFLTEEEMSVMKYDLVAKDTIVIHEALKLISIGDKEFNKDFKTFEEMREFVTQELEREGY
jgi:hypothetical protein